MSATKKGIILAVAGGVLVAAVIILVARARRPVVSDRQQILQLIEDMRLAVERKSVSGCMHYLSQDYHDAGGSRRDLQRLMVGAFRTANDIELSVQADQIEVTGRTAAISVRADVTSVSREGARDTTPLVVRATLAKEKGRWVVTHAEGYEEGGTAFE